MAEKLYHTSRVHRPSIKLLEDLAAENGLDISKEELEAYKRSIDQSLKCYDVLDKYPDPLLPVKLPRMPGYRPSEDENKFNAWYYKTNIKGADAGKLAGKTVAVKDNVPVAGVPMMNGSALLEGCTPEFDATVVTRILDAGGTITGKATCEYLCLSGSSHTSSTGPVLNPQDVTRSAGGSSSGSAVLVASGEVDMALGGDQGGSIRMPACWCGVVGLKPTWGLVPYTGIFAVEPIVDHVGPITRTVKDCALLLEVLAGYDDGLDARQPPNLKVPKYTEMLTSDLSTLRVGVVDEGFVGCEPDVASIVIDAAKCLSDLGASVDEISIPMHTDGIDIVTPVYVEGMYSTMLDGAGILMGYKGFQTVSMSDAFQKGYKTRVNDDLSHLMKVNVLCSAFIEKYYGRHYYGRAVNVSRLLTQKYDEALQRYEVLIMPTIKFKAPKLPDSSTDVYSLISNTSQNHNTAPFNLTGHPACSINAGFSNGLPVGMMIIGKHFDEATVLKVAYAYEQHRDGK